MTSMAARLAHILSINGARAAVQYGRPYYSPPISLPQTSTNAMAQKDHLPLVFQFGEVDSGPNKIENKEEWGLMDMAQNELAAAVPAPAPVPAPTPAPAPATNPVALTG